MSSPVAQAQQPIADMTRAELMVFIHRIVEARLKGVPILWPGQRTDRPVAEVLASMRHNLWTPPAGAKSSLEMLREDREA